MNKFIIKPWYGILGFLGLLGFVPINGQPSYFFFMFFSFFSWYWWAKLPTNANNDTFTISQQKTGQIMCGVFALLSFFILFFLDRGSVSIDTIIALGTLFYSISFISIPVLLCYFEKIKI